MNIDLPSLHTVISSGNSYSFFRNVILHSYFFPCVNYNLDIPNINEVELADSFWDVRYKSVKSKFNERLIQ